MSDTRHEDALLLGFTGPTFTGLECVQKLYLGTPDKMNANFFEFIRTRLPHADDALGKDVETSDRYVWPTAIYFNYHGHRIAVLMPDVLDVSGHEMYSDRHVALYYQGAKASQRILAEIIVKVQSVFLKAYYMKYGELP